MTNHPKLKHHHDRRSTRHHLSHFLLPDDFIYFKISLLLCGAQYLSHSLCGRFLPPWSCSTNFPLSLHLSVLTHPQKHQCLTSPVLTSVAHIVLVAHDVQVGVGGVHPTPLAGASLIGRIVSEPHAPGRPVNPRRLILVLKMGTFSSFLLFSQKPSRGRRVEHSRRGPRTSTSLAMTE